MNKSAKEWSQHHPEALFLPSDLFYSRLQQRLVKTLTGASRSIDILAQKRVVGDIAFRCAAYIEDIVSDFGIFQTFRNLHEQLKGEPFGGDDPEYLEDEVNLPDICLLVKLSLPSDIDKGDENCRRQIREIAELLFPKLCEAWESAPECAPMCGLLHNLVRSDEYSKAVSLMIWLFSKCYLTRVDEAIEELDAMAHNYSKQTGLEYDQLRYTFLCNGAAENISPLLGANYPEFQAALARTYGFEEAAAHLEELIYIPTSVYEILEVNEYFMKAKCLQSEDSVPGAMGMTIDVSLSSLYLKHPVEKGLYFTGAVMRYAGVWNLNGMAIFNTENPLD